MPAFKLTRKPHILLRRGPPAGRAPSASLARPFRLCFPLHRSSGVGLAARLGLSQRATVGLTGCAATWLGMVGVWRRMRVNGYSILCKS